MLIGGAIGAIVSLCLAWSYVIVIKKGSFALHPIAVIGNVFVAWVGAVVGALLSVFKRKGYKNHTR
jgi:hypothetical protein